MACVEPGVGPPSPTDPSRLVSDPRAGETCQESPCTPPALHGMNPAQAMPPEALPPLDKSAASWDMGENAGRKVTKDGETYSVWDTALHILTSKIHPEFMSARKSSDCLREKSGVFQGPWMQKHVGSARKGTESSLWILLCFSGGEHKRHHFLCFV